MAERHVRTTTGGGETQRPVLTPNYPVWFMITSELLHYITRYLYVGVSLWYTLIFTKLKDVGNTLYV